MNPCIFVSSQKRRNLNANSIWILLKDTSRSEPEITETHLPSYEERDDDDDDNDDDDDDDWKRQRGQRIIVCHKCLHSMVASTSWWGLS